MAKIIWLASYPKSGNTWLRAFLFNYITDDEQYRGTLKGLHGFGFGDMDARFYREALGEAFEAMTDARIDAARHDVQAHIAKTNEGNPIVKTHSGFRLRDRSPAINAAVTKCAVYAVRNPLDLVVSFADHYGASLDDAIAASGSSEHTIPAVENRVRQYLGSWSEHAIGWLGAAPFPRMAMRYEDMVRDPARAFGQLIDFLKLEKSEARMKRALEDSSFDRLKAREAEEGFAERSPNSERFFRSGTFGGWRSVLTDRQTKRVLDAHGPVMKKLGYLDEAGEIRF